MHIWLSPRFTKILAMEKIEAAALRDIDNAASMRQQDPWESLQRLSNVFASYANGIGLEKVLSIRGQGLRFALKLGIL